MSKALAALAKEGKINEGASLRDRQSVIINAPIGEVWKKLSDLSEWPRWNQDITDITVEKLEQGASFQWKMTNSKINSVFQIVDPPNMLTWTGNTLWIKAVNVWKLEATEEYQTIVSAEESLEGFLLPLFISHLRLHSSLLNWLSRLKHECEGLNASSGSLVES